MRSYEAARGLFGFLGFVAWCAIVVGVLVAISAASAMGQMRSFGGAPNGMAVMMATIPGLAMAISGFLSLALVQTGRAAVDTAEYTQQMLKIARDQLEVSRDALRQGETIQKSFAALQSNADAEQIETPTNAPSYRDDLPVSTKALKLEHVIGTTIEYGSKRIKVTKDGYVFGDAIYPTLDEAKAKIDEQSTSPKISSTLRVPSGHLPIDPKVIADTLKRS
ncbi:hypothetical protein [Primorskyibacter sp. 2E233]|uniref:hypothetical protein n=1 Tax=Primorskyibacter sp. 2E233 TaxID=3413431 RepID=UPI003BF0FD04